MSAAELTVVGFRLPFRHFSDPAQLKSVMLSHIAGAGVPTESLVVFPGLMAMGLLPAELSMVPVGLAERLRQAGADLEASYLAIGEELARERHIYLVPGSVWLPAPIGYTHRAALFDPEGRLLGWQEQTHAYLWEAELIAAAEVAVWQVGPMRVGLLLGADPWVPEVSRVLTLQGADLLVAPLAPIAPYGSARAMAGLWQEVQQNQTFGLETGLSGTFFDLGVDGKLAVFAPCELTPGETGFFGEAGYVLSQQVRSAKLEPADLYALRERYPLLRHLNPDLYRRHWQERPEARP